MIKYIDIFQHNPFDTWIIIGIILIITEIFISNIGFLFSGLSALTIAILINLNLLDNDIYGNIKWFLVFLLFYGLILWIPIKKLLKSKQNNLNNIIGDNAIVIGKDLLPNMIGKVKWSGTIFNAKIFADQNDLIETGSIVEIMNIEGNILFVKKLLIVYN